MGDAWPIWSMAVPPRDAGWMPHLGPSSSDLQISIQQLRIELLSTREDLLRTKIEVQELKRRITLDENLYRLKNEEGRSSPKDHKRSKEAEASIEAPAKPKPSGPLTFNFGFVVEKCEGKPGCTFPGEPTPDRIQSWRRLCKSCREAALAALDNNLPLPIEPPPQPVHPGVPY
jgi:hypothetical protein